MTAVAVREPFMESFESISASSSYGGNPSPQCSVPRTYLVASQATGGGSIEAGRDVAAGQQASFTLTTPQGYTVQVSGCGGSLAGNTYTTATITGNCTISATFAPPPTNGACGSTAPSLTLPTLLCSAGSATNQSAAADAFRWDCAGISGGTTATSAEPLSPTSSAISSSPRSRARPTAQASTRSVVLPMVTRAPTGTATAPLMRCWLTNVPLVLPRSSTTTLCPSK